MIAADNLDRRSAKLLTIAADGHMRHLPRTALANLFGPGDLVVANDAATLPASLYGTHAASGEAIEIRLAGWLSFGDPSRFLAIAFGAGDHRTRTEDRPPPALLFPGDRLRFGERQGQFTLLPRNGADRASRVPGAKSELSPAYPLAAVVERLAGHPRLVELRFVGSRAHILAGLASHGRPIQYAHVPEPLALWDVWTSIAAAPVAFEAPSAGFALDWRTLHAWRQRGVGFATLTHAAGISSTGDLALDLQLPFDELYRIPAGTAAAIVRAKAAGRRVIAIGTTVVRALEAAANAEGVRAGYGIADGRIAHDTPLRVADAILTGIHQPGESHFELLRAFADDGMLDRVAAAVIARDYRVHEFGDSMLLERQLRLDVASHHATIAGRFPGIGKTSVKIAIDTPK